VACNQQAVVLSIPIVDTGLALTYSSQWAAARTDRAGWNANSLGLAGWSLNVLERYDPTNGVLIGGDGTWRFATAVPAGSGQTAVPTFDGATAYVFDAAGRHVQTVDAHLGTTMLAFGYDAAGRLLKVDGTVAGQAAHLTVQRAADGTPRALIGTDGASTLLSLDVNGNLVGIQSSAGATTSIAWAPGGLPTAETDPLGGVTRYIYDSAGLLVGSTDPDGIAQQLSETAGPSTIEVKVTSTQGRTSTYRSEALSAGLRRTYVGPDGATTTETTAPDGSLKLVLPDGTSRSVGAVPSALWGMAAPIQTPDVETRPDGVVSRTDVKQELAAVDGVPYRLTGSVTTTVNGEAWVESFDPTARTTNSVDPVGRRSIETFDQAGRLVAESIPGSAPATFTYDPVGRLASRTLGTGALAQTTSYAYNAASGTVTFTRPDGTSETTVFDAAGRPTITTEPDGSSVIAVYDAAGRTSQVQPAGGLSFTLGNSPAGRPTAFLPPAVTTDASVEIAHYDSDGNLAAISGLGTRTISAAYDAAGRVIGWTFDQGTTTVAYDPTSGLVTRAADPGGVITTYGYAGSLPDKLTWSGGVGGSVALTLDANGRAAAEAVDGSGPMRLAYDASGELTSIDQLTMSRDPASGLITQTTLGSVDTAETYDASGRLARATTKASGKVVLDLQYRRDFFGRVTMVREIGANGSTTTTAYSYDDADRLTQVELDGKLVETDRYDSAGNRTTVTAPSGSIKATYDARDRLLTWGATTYSWSASGTLTERAGGGAAATFTFDDFGQLRQATSTGDGATVTYAVDAQGRRVGRSVNGQLVAGYLYNPAGEIVAETDGSGAVVARFGYDDLGHLALVERGSAAYRVVTDQVGSPRLVIDPTSGAVVDAITYNSWGRIKAESAPGTLPFGFGGGLLDPTTGLVHLGARDYDPLTGRWTGPDPLRFGAGDPNLYRYASGDPINQSDPTGTGTCTYLVALGGVLSLSLGGYGPLLYGATAPVCPPPPDQPPSTPPTNPRPNGDNCIALLCLPPGTSPLHTGCVAFFAWCDSGPGGTFNCVGILCTGPNGQNCFFGGCSYGDTHIYTADGVHYDFQAAGEFIALTSPDRAIEVQVRQEPWFGSTQVTFATAVAARVDGDRVGVYAKEPTFLRVNGVAVDPLDFAERLPNGGSVERHGGLVTIGWPDGSRLTIQRVANSLNYSFRPGNGVGPTLRGLLGSGDGNPANDLIGRDGVVLDRADPAFATKLYGQFGKSWRILPGESLFDYLPGESTATFTRLDIPSSAVTSSSLAASVRTNAEAVCRAVGVQSEPLLDDCVVDVGVTGDSAFAAGEAEIAATGSPPNASSGTGNVHELTLGQAISGTIATPAQHDDYTLSAAAGQIVYLQAQGTCVAGLQWALLRPDGSPEGFELSCRDLGRVVLATPGIWTVRVSGTETGTGSYTFTASAVPAPIVGQLVLGQPVGGSIGQIGAWYDYTLNVTAGQIVYLQAQGTCVSGLQWALLRPDGSPEGFELSCHDLGRVVFSTSGIWTVRVYSEGTAMGAFAFTAQAVAPPVTAIIVMGQTVSGRIGQIGAWYDYAFSASPGEIVNLHGSGVCMAGLSWALIRPDGTLQDFGLTCRNLGREVLASPGIWTVRVYSDGVTTGAYSFTVSAGK
jgi:RHS repeat-associated protein